MLFNSYTFLGLFLPPVLAGYYALRGRGRAPFLWLLGASFVFYGWSEPAHVVVLIVSILVNALVATAITRTGRARWLAAGVATNVLILGVFKYTGVAVPLGISFITVQQIGYLVDAYRGEVERNDLLDLALLVAFFPHLIAGPILRARDVTPQFHEARGEGAGTDLAVGTTLFVAGLFKKVMLADSLAVYVAVVFDGSAAAGRVALGEAWAAALAYTLQLYFDFSGYSDMALGLGRMLGIRLPLNFDAPYRAPSVIDFWKRWHMTLSRFLFEDVFFPLASRRPGLLGRYGALVVTMIVAGLWHGVGVTFIVWGALHGFYLVVNHAWRHGRRIVGLAAPRTAWWGRPLAVLTTFTAVVVAWTIFRAPSWTAAVVMLQGLAGLSGGHGLGAFGATPGASARRGLATIVVLLAVTWLAPTAAQWLARWSPALEPVRPSRWQWRPTPAWGAVLGLMLAGCLYFMLTRRMEFLYFQF